MVCSPPGCLTSAGNSAASFIGYQFLTASEGNIASETRGHCPVPIITLLWTPALSPESLERGMVQSRALHSNNGNWVYSYQAARLMARKNFLTAEEEPTFILIPWKFLYVTIISLLYIIFPSISYQDFVIWYLKQYQ